MDDNLGHAPRGGRPLRSPAVGSRRIVRLSESDRFDLWFVHEPLLISLLSPAAVADLRRSLPGPNAPMAEAFRLRILGDALAAYVLNHDIASVDVAHLHNGLEVGSLVWLEQAIAFKGVRRAFQSRAA